MRYNSNLRMRQTLFRPSPTDASLEADLKSAVTRCHMWSFPMGSDDAGNGAVMVFETVTVALRTHKVLACVKSLVLAHFCRVIRRSTD